MLTREAGGQVGSSEKARGRAMNLGQFCGY